MCICWAGTFCLFYPNLLSIFTLSMLIISTSDPSSLMILSFLNSVRVLMKLSFVVPANSASSLRVNGKLNVGLSYISSEKYN